MNKLFDIKRTKMIDEAAFGHKPSTFGRTLGTFLLVLIITSLASGLIVGITTTVYDAIKNNVFSNMMSIAQSSGYESAMTYFEESAFSFPWWMTYVSLFSSAIVIFGAIFYCVKFEKCSVSSMGLRKNGVAIELLFGFLIGAAFIGIVFLVLHFSGAVSFERHPDTRILRPSIILLFFGYMVQVVSEELLYRGFFLTSLSRDIRPIFASLLCALVYSLFNFYSIFSFINAFLFAFLLNIYVLKRGSIWGTIALRFVWCFVQGAVLGGTGFGASIFIPKYNVSLLYFTGSPLEGGFESGLIFSIVLICAIMIVLLLKTKKSERSCVQIEYFN